MSNQDPAYQSEEVPSSLECREYTRQRLSAFTPKLQRIALGDFSVEFEVPQEEDELTELTTALSLMLDDLREYKKAQDEYKKTQKELTSQLQNKIKELQTFNSAMVNRELKMVQLKEEIASLREQLQECKNQSSR